jgi:hypothetical protein
MDKELNYNRVLLKKVLSRFKNGKNETKYICTESAIVAGVDAFVYIGEHIEDLLSPTLTAEAWLIKQGIRRSLVWDSRLMREYRIRWMEHMLKNDPFFASQKAD